MRRNFLRRRRKVLHDFSVYRIQLMKLLVSLMRSRFIIVALITFTVVASGFFMWLHTEEVDATPYFYIEDFYTNTFEDTSNTTGVWNVFTGRAELANEVWMKVDNTQAGSNNVSNTPLNDSLITKNSIATDSANNPHIVWVESVASSTEIFYKYWDGTQWVEQNVSNTGTSSLDPAIALDVNDYPHIAWIEDTGLGNPQIYYTYWDGFGWQVANGAIEVPGTFDDPYDVQIEVQNGITHIGWLDFDSILNGLYNQYYTYWNGVSWGVLGGTALVQDGVNNVRLDTTTSMVIDSNDIPHLVYANGFVMTHRYWDGVGWNSFGVISVGNSKFPDIALDDNDYPHVVFLDDTDTLRYRHWDGFDWQVVGSTEVVDGAGEYQPVIDVDANNFAHIAYAKTVGSDVEVLYTYWNGSEWTARPSLTTNITNNAVDDVNPAFVLDSEDNTHLIWTQGSPGEVYYTKWTRQYLTQSEIQSLQVDTTADIIQQAIVDADLDEPIGTSVDSIEISANGGSNWCAVTLGSVVDFSTCAGDVRGNDLRWRAVLLTTDPDQTPAIEKLAIQYFTKSITVTNPVGGEKFNENATESITWTSAYPQTQPIGNVNLYYADDAGCSVNVQTIATNEANDGHYEWDLSASGISVGTYYLCIRETAMPTIVGVSGSFEVVASLLHTFDFSNNADYTISNPVEAEVAGGVARFVAVSGVAQQQNAQLNFAGSDRAKYTADDFAKGIEIHNTGAVKLAGFGENYAFSSNKRLYGVDYINGEIECYNPDNGFVSCGSPFPLVISGGLGQSANVVSDADGNLWYTPSQNALGGGGGIFCLDGDNGYTPCTGVNFDSNGQLLTATKTSIFSIDAQGNIWERENGGDLYCYDAQNNYNPCATPSIAVGWTGGAYMHPALFDQNGYLWVNYEIGMKCFDPNAGYGSCGVYPIGAPSVAISNRPPMIDIFGNIWFTSQDGWTLTDNRYLHCLDASNSYNSCDPIFPLLLSDANETNASPSLITNQKGQVIWGYVSEPDDSLRCIDPFNGYGQCSDFQTPDRDVITMGINKNGDVYRAYVTLFEIFDGVTGISLDTGVVDMFYNYSFSNGNEFAFMHANYPTNEYQWVTTSHYNNIYTENWLSIDGVDVKSLEPTPWGATTAIRYFVSFDNRSTWKYWDGVAWQAIAGQPTDADFATVGMTTAQIEGLSSADWSSVGGFDPGATTHLDLAIGLYTNHSGVSPIVDEVVFNFTPQYTVDIPTVENKIGAPFANLVSFSAQVGPEHTGTVEFQISNGSGACTDGVSTNEADCTAALATWDPQNMNWYYHDGGTWALSASATPYQDEQTNSDDEINQHIASFVGTVGNGDFYFKAFLVNNKNVGSEFVQLSGVTVGYSTTFLEGVIITDATYTEVASVDVGDDLYFQLTGSSLNTNAGVVETVQAVVSSTTGDSETITLTETGVNTSIFRFGPLPTASTAGADDDGTLQVSEGDTITVTVGVSNQYYEKNIPATNAKGISFLKTFTSPVDFGADDFFIDVYVNTKANIDTAVGTNFNNPACDASLGGSLGVPPGGLLVFTTVEAGDTCTIGAPETKAWGYSFSTQIPNLVDGQFTTLSFDQGSAIVLSGPGIDWSAVKQILLFLPTNGNSLVIRLDNLRVGNAPGVMLDDFESYTNSTEMFASGYSEYDTVTRDQDTPTLQQQALLYTDTATVNVMTPPPGGGDDDELGSSVSAVHPMSVTPTATSLSYTFVDLSNPINQTSYAFYINDVESTNNSNVGFSSRITNGTFEGTFIETGLQPNTAYDNRAVTAKIGTQESPSRDFGVNYTLAAVPGAPTVSLLDATTAKLIINTNNNPSYTKYKIFESTTNRYLTNNGQLVSFIQSDFYTFDEFGGVNGIIIPNLTTGQTYSFSVQAINEDDIVTAFGPAAEVTMDLGPVPNLTAELRVGINVDSGRVQGAFASTFNKFNKPFVQFGNATTQTVVDNVQAIFNLFLIVLALIFVSAIYTIFTSLERTGTIGNKIIQLPRLLRREASEFFGEFAKKAPNGVYEYSFAQHKRLHKLSRVSLFSGVGVLIAKAALVVAVTLFGTGIYSTLAQFDNYNGNGQTVQPGDVLSYAVIFENTGTATADNVVITIPLSPYLTYVTGSGEMSSGAAVNNITLAEGILTFQVGSVAPGETGYVKFVTTVNLDVQDGAVISAQSNITADNQASLTTNTVTNIVSVDELIDEDGDGYVQGLDCNDTDSTIYPGAPEIADDGIDQDCDGEDLITIIEEPEEPTEPQEPEEPTEPQEPEEPTEPQEPEEPTEPQEPEEPTEPTADNRTSVQVTSPLQSDEATPPIYGIGESGALIEVAIDGRVIGTVTVNANGTWSIALPFAFQSGSYTLTVRDIEVDKTREYTLTITEKTIIEESTQPVEPTQREEEGTFLGRLDDLVDTSLPFLDNKQVETTTQNIIIPGLTALSATLTLPAIAAGTFNVVPYLHLLFFEPFAALFRRRRTKYGTVYNALSKVPLDLAVVRLFDAKTKKLVSTKITDKQGRFYLLAKQGEYVLSVSKPNFIYPTQYLKEDKEDTQYTDIYHGEKLQVTEDGTPITVNIPLDPKEQKAQAVNKEVRSYLIQKGKVIISASGIILAAIAFVVYPTLLMGGFLATHIILYIVFRRVVAQRRPKSWGIVYDEKSGEPLKHAVVRIFDTRFNKLLETYVTDGSGRYSFLVGQNQYQIMGSKQGYLETKTEVIDLTNKPIEEGIIAQDLNLVKAQQTTKLSKQGRIQDIPLKHKASTSGKVNIEDENFQEVDLSSIDMGNL